jgi:hypothetical protein
MLVLFGHVMDDYDDTGWLALVLAEKAHIDIITPVGCGAAI